MSHLQDYDGLDYVRELEDERTQLRAELDRLEASGGYTKADILKAVEGARTNALEEATNNVCARISTWLMARSVSMRTTEERASEVLEEAALDILDGEWRREPRPTAAKNGGEGG